VLTTQRGSFTPTMYQKILRP